MRLIILLVAGLMLLTSCEDSGTNSSETDHLEAEGLVLFDGTTPVWVYFQGQADTLKKALGQDPLYTLRFLDGDSVLITEAESHEEDEDHPVNIVIADTTIATIIHHEETEVVAEHDFEFYLNGKTTGQTTITFSVMHGDHVDVGPWTAPIAIVPAAPTTAREDR